LNIEIAISYNIEDSKLMIFSDRYYTYVAHT